MESLPVDNRKRRRVLGASLLALAAAVAGGIALGFLEMPGQVQRLPDGSVLELRGVTYGPNGAFFDGNGWQKALFRLGKQGSEIGGYLDSPANSEMNLWFRYRGVPKAPPDGIAGWIDEHGCRIRDVEGGLGRTDSFLSSTYGDYRWGDPRYRLAQPRVFPRRQTTATYALLGKTRAEPFAGFTVPVPPGGPFPEWQGRPLPAASRVGDTTFTLTQLQQRKEAAFDSRTATFKYSGSSPHSRNWRPYSVTVSDATGNEVTTSFEGSQDDDHQATFDSLCAHEPVWKIKAQFVRDRPLEVPPDLVWTVRNVPAPRKNQAIERSDFFTQGGITLWLLMLRGAGTYTWSAGGGSSSYPGLELQVESFEGCRVEIMRLTNQMGRNLIRNSGDENLSEQLRGGTLEPGRFALGLLFPYPVGTTRLNVTFGVWKMRTAEFLVRP